MEIALQIVYTKINFLAWVYHGCRWCIRFMPSDTCSKKYIDRSLGEWFVSKGELDHVFLKFVSESTGRRSRTPEGRDSSKNLRANVIGLVQACDFSTFLVI